MILAQLHRVAPAGPLPAQKRGPVVVKVPKCDRLVNVRRLYSEERRLLEGLLKDLRIADGKTQPLIDLRGGRIDGDGRIPEAPDELHAAGIVPHVCGDDSSRA